MQVVYFEWDPPAPTTSTTSTTSASTTSGSTTGPTGPPSTAQTNLEYEPRPAMNDLFGINFNWWVRNDVFSTVQWPNTTSNPSLPYNNTYLPKIFNATQARVTRYPGGTTSTFWNITSNAFVYLNSSVCSTMANSSTYSVKCSNYINANTSNQNTFPDGYLNMQSFGEAMHAIRLDWIFVANLYTTDAQAIIDALDAVCSPGNVACPTYLELGNEYYLSNFYPSGLLPNSSVYLDRITPVYNATSKYFNNSIVAIGALNGWMTTSQTDSGVKWNKGLVGANGVAYDHLTIHAYSQRASNFRSVNSDAWYTYLLTWPETLIRLTYERASVQFPNVQLWMTEFNYGVAEAGSDGTHDAADSFTTSQDWQPSHGLVIAGYYLSMMKYPDTYTKAWLFETMKDGFLSSYMVNSSGTYTYSTGQIYSHLSYIMKTHDTFAYISFANTDSISISKTTGGSPWYGGWTGSLTALQGVLFDGGDKGLTYVILNRVNYTIPANLTQSSQYKSVTVYEYPGGIHINQTLFQIDIDAEPSFPWAGPIPVQTTTSSNNDYYLAQIGPLSLTIIHFDWNDTSSTSSSAPTSTTSDPASLTSTTSPTSTPSPTSSTSSTSSTATNSSTSATNNPTTGTSSTPTPTPSQAPSDSSSTTDTTDNATTQVSIATHSKIPYLLYALLFTFGVFCL
eukprot:Phypoly_transcript_04298.p1 GENE.Phypoly_transcript_04298~~Phypoly_transcript_04298.p1  ORF type:complete len:677 (+),score=103.36 Phypoly_transcript_04298:166-2196(+)